MRSSALISQETYIPLISNMLVYVVVSDFFTHAGCV